MIKEVEFSKYLENLPKYIEEKCGTVFVLSNKTYVLIGQDEIDEDYCKENDLPILKTHKFGGTIINFKDDLCIGNYSAEDNTFGIDCMNILKDYLVSKNINAIIEDNDVLIEGKYKVGSFGSFWVNGCLYTYTHFTINMDIELIEKVCKKEMKKIPKAMSDYGITLKDIKKLFLSKLGE